MQLDSLEDYIWENNVMLENLKEERVGIFLNTVFKSKISEFRRDKFYYKLYSFR